MYPPARSGLQNLTKVMAIVLGGGPTQKCSGGSGCRSILDLTLSLTRLSSRYVTCEKTITYLSTSVSDPSVE